MTIAVDLGRKATKQTKQNRDDIFDYHCLKNVKFIYYTLNLFVCLDLCLFHQFLVLVAGLRNGW